MLKKIFKHISEADKHVWGFNNLLNPSFRLCVFDF